MRAMKVTTNFASVESSVQIAGTPRANGLHAVLGASAAAPAPTAAAAHSWHAPHAGNDLSSEGTLTRAEFLRMIQREKRRTDRSHSALSLALLSIDGAQEGAVAAVLEKVGAMVRETDYTAAIDHDSIAVLLPDTGEAGLNTFLDKVALARHTHVLSAVGSTYPDAAFDRLVTDRMGTPRSRHPAHAEESVQAAATHVYPLKRTLDVAGSIAALLLLSPLILLIAIGIKLTSSGPVIFRQQRIGKGGVPFTFYKFRSMRTDNDDRVHRDYVAKLIDGKATAAGDAAGAAGPFKMKADPRVTPIGRFIRRTSVDEIPQFWNVLKGDMSLVGPRPPVPYEADRYKTWHRRRVFELKPGLTGIWQVEGRSRVSFDDMVRMDLRYLRECSLRFDLKILVRTVSVVLLCQGAQ
jgi:lipopolysaccharide/colanic/teichoic acid biosynthesis glycosyltransferase